MRIFYPELVCGNLMLRPSRMTEIGDHIEKHKHNFDHTTFVTKGVVRIQITRPDGSQAEKVFQAGEFCLVRAEDEHEVTAVEVPADSTCIYAHMTPQGTVSQVYTGWNDAYAELRPDGQLTPLPASVEPI